MIFARTLVHSSYTPYSIYFRMAVYFCSYSVSDEADNSLWPRPPPGCQRGSRGRQGAGGARESFRPGRSGGVILGSVYIIIIVFNIV